jgi:hypothetical protein
MSTVYMVSYDLRKPGQDYAGIYDALQSFPSWWHYLDTTWLIVSDLDPAGIFERLAPHLDQNDSLIVMEVVNRKAGWLPQKAWEWIDEHGSVPGGAVADQGRQ